MTEFTKRPDGLIVPAGINRRGFLAGTAALGIAAGLGSSLVGGEARAQEPKRGGHLKLGLDGGATTDSLDPASYSGSVSFVIGHLWGDTLVESHPETGAPLPSIASSWESSADASVWTFKIRKDIAFHDGRKLAVADVIATLKRHSDEGSKSGALGLMRSVKAIEEKAGDLVLTLTEGNADLPLLLTDYHLIIQ
ncbi:ABC transporter substrate-binding protein, partial [Sinorhizobium medicae]